MSDDEAAFLRGIRANPDADLPRLVYADWLDERGHQLRAQFLRAHPHLRKSVHGQPTKTAAARARCQISPPGRSCEDEAGKTSSQEVRASCSCAVVALEITAVC